ncbi:hypothetical protein AZH53_03765 [Methanomicrobiaceae archaeon CYW5]|uniref:KEOPS complex subunit Pcc1 n=1 Tax=Methanovulcanius yangii TaxID=1789227 RepID=UPI0029C9E4C9|nr:KEOPS complex subunit Pcc1 [Methanovulcanius yangii]MBT8507538.1 hypothetical protein [Methanovulcanius yangii]
MKVHGIIRTRHARPDCVAAALHADNLLGMDTHALDGIVETTLTSEKLRSTIASVDDYLMNLAIAEDTCCYVSH